MLAEEVDLNNPDSCTLDFAKGEVFATKAAVKFIVTGRFVGEVPRMLFILYTISILLVPSILATAMPIHYLSALLRFAPMAQL